MDVYTERAALVSVIFRIAAERGMRAWWYIDPDLDDDEYPVVALQLPEGQVSFHIYIDDFRDFFAWVEEGHPEWDGHNKEEAFERLTSHDWTDRG